MYITCITYIKTQSVERKYTLTISHMSGVQNPRTIPVNSHSLPPKLSRICRGVGFGFRGCISLDFLFRGTSATVLFIMTWYQICSSAGLPRGDW